MENLFKLKIVNMKKLKMIVTSIIVLVIIGSAFAFNAKKNWIYCTSGGTSTTCNQISSASVTLKRDGGVPNVYYVPCWEGGTCNQTCTISAHFSLD